MFKKSLMSRAVVEAMLGCCAFGLVTPLHASDMVLDCEFLGGVTENGICRYVGDTPGTGLADMGTEWLYLDDDWRLSHGSAVIGEGLQPFSTFIYNVATDGVTRKIQNVGTGTLTISGGSAPHAWGIAHLALGLGAIGELGNESTGAVVLKGGTGLNSQAINTIARDGAVGQLSNDQGGTFTISGGDGVGAQGINALAKGKTSVGRIINQGTMQVYGSEHQADLLANGIYALVLNGGSAEVTNQATGSLTFVGHKAPGVYVFADGRHARSEVTLTNQGAFAIQGGEASGVYLLSQGEGHVTLNNQRQVEILGGSASGIHVMAHEGGCVDIENHANAMFAITAGEHAAIDVMSLTSGSTQLTNDGTLTITGSASAPGIAALASGGTTTLINTKNGTINLLGSAQQSAIGVLAEMNGAGIIQNDGTINLHKDGLGLLAGPGGKATIVTGQSGVLNAQVLALFEGRMEAPLIQEVVKPVVIINPEGRLQTVESESYKATTVSQQGELTLKKDWIDHASWAPGGALTFTDMAPGSDLAQSVASQIHAAFGEGVRVSFKDSSTDNPTGNHAVFDLKTYNTFKKEKLIAPGSIVASETLHHEGHTLTVGRNGDIEDDVGFQGVHGTNGILVTDGRTLTLMGSEKPLMAEVREALPVVTDAEVRLQNGQLNLGHRSYADTQGRLAAIQYDHQSSVNVNRGAFTLASLEGDGTLRLGKGTRTTIEGDLSAMQVMNAGTLKVKGQTVLGGSPATTRALAMPKKAVLSNESGATADFEGDLIVNDFVTVKNREGASIRAGHVVVDTFGRIINYPGATMSYASIEADGVVSNQGSLAVQGRYVIGDEGESTFAGQSTLGRLSLGRRANLILIAKSASEPLLKNRGTTYVGELELLSGRVLVEDHSILAGESLKNGAIGAHIVVNAGGTFGFSHDKASLAHTLANFKGNTRGKAIVALNTDLHFTSGGSLTVGHVHDAKGTVNLGADALLLLGTTALHGQALFNGSAQHLHVEPGATIALTDALLWGNHYLMQGFDEASTKEILKVGVQNQNGRRIPTHVNDRGIFVTVGSDNIHDKDKDYRLFHQMNWLLDGHQDVASVKGDVAFLTSALIDEKGALATNRMESLPMAAGLLAETQRMGATVQTTMLDHVVSTRKDAGIFWTQGLISKTDAGAFERMTGTSSYEADTTGFVFGLDFPLGEDALQLGAAFSAHRGELEGDFGLTSDIEGYGVSLYAGKTFHSGLNLSGAMTYFTASHAVDADILGKVKADADAQMWVVGARLTMAADWLTPYIGVDVMKVRQEGFTASWRGMSAFDYAAVDATLFRTPVGFKVGTFMPLTVMGHSGILNWDADLAFIPEFGEKDADFRVRGVSNGHSDGVIGSFVNNWLTTAKIGLGWQGKSGAFGISYTLEKGEVRGRSSCVQGKAAIFF